MRLFSRKLVSILNLCNDDEGSNRERSRCSCVKIVILMYSPRLYPRVKLTLVAVKVLKQIGLTEYLLGSNLVDGTKYTLVDSR